VRSVDDETVVISAVKTSYTKAIIGIKAREKKLKPMSFYSDRAALIQKGPVQRL
jgi:hypothetical protein